MAEYIAREVLLAQLREMESYNASPMYRRGYDDCVETILKAPAADVVPVVHGEWLLRHEGHGHYWECSVCHKNPCIYVTKDTNYCPNCGAKMRREDENA